MPVVIDSVTYYPFDAHVVQDVNAQPVPGATGLVYAIGDTGLTTPLTIKEITGTTIPNLVVNPQSISPQFLAPALEVIVDFGVVPLAVASADVPNLAQDAAAAKVAAEAAAVSSAASAALRKTVVLTQAAYNALTPAADTVYFIVG